MTFTVVQLPAQVRSAESGLSVALLLNSVCLPAGCTSLNVPRSVSCIVPRNRFAGFTDSHMFKGAFMVRSTAEFTGIEGPVEPRRSSPHRVRPVVHALPARAAAGFQGAGVGSARADAAGRLEDRRDFRADGGRGAIRLSRAARPPTLIPLVCRPASRIVAPDDIDHDPLHFRRHPLGERAALFGTEPATPAPLRSTLCLPRCLGAR